MTYSIQSTNPVPPGKLTVALDLGRGKMMSATLVPVIEIPDPAGDKKLREDVAYLRLVNKWREGQIEAGIIFEPEPHKITLALENVTGHLLRELNKRWAENPPVKDKEPRQPFDNWHSTSCPANKGEVNCTCDR